MFSENQKLKCNILIIDIMLPKESKKYKNISNSDSDSDSGGMTIFDSDSDSDSGGWTSFDSDSDSDSRRKPPTPDS